jgi:hypothetical protein
MRGIGINEVLDMTYEEYCLYAKGKGFQPLGIVAFELMIAAGFDFESRKFIN